MVLSQYLRIIWARKWLVLLLFVVIARGRQHRHHDSAEPVHGRDLAGRRDADRPRARRARAGAGGAELHGNPDRDHQERAGRFARGQDPRRRALRCGRGAVARGDEGEDSRSSATSRACSSAASPVEPARGSNVINLTFSGPDPIFAQAAANAFAQAYMDVSVELRVAPARQSATFLDEQTKVLRANLETGAGQAVQVPAGQGHRRQRRAPRPGKRALQRADRAARDGPGRAGRNRDPAAQHRRRVLARRPAERRRSRASRRRSPPPRPSSPRSAASSARTIRRASQLEAQIGELQEAARGRDAARRRRRVGDQSRQLAEGRRAADDGRRAEEAAARRCAPIATRSRSTSATSRPRSAPTRPSRSGSARSTWKARTTRPTRAC